MVDCFNKIYLNDHKYQTNGTTIYESYKLNFLFPMNNFVLFGEDSQSMFFMSTRFLKY